jgi:hypothetical protein
MQDTYYNTEMAENDSRFIKGGELEAYLCDVFGSYRAFRIFDIWIMFFSFLNYILDVSHSRV